MDGEIIESYPEKIREKLEDYNIAGTDIETVLEQLKYFVEHKSLK